MENHITLFTNGIADFSLVYDVQRDGTDIIIPVKKENLSDAINMAVFGARAEDRIRWVSSSFQSTHQSTISIKPDNVFESLFVNLSGAIIKVTRSDRKVFKGRLVGVDEQDKVRMLTIFQKDICVRIPFSEIVDYEFTEIEVKEELQKALHANFAKITPQSSQIRLRLSCEGETEKALVCFTTQVAAWTMAYQIRKIGDTYRLTGIAIVHNNTDQEWKGKISCVTGIPYTIKTNIASPTVPVRNAPLKQYGGFESINSPAEAKEVGDFSVLTPKGIVTIPSNSSSPMVVIEVDIRECQAVLYYNYREDENRGRPEMGLEFRNPLPHSLQNGPCNVYSGGLFQGTGMMELTKGGEKQKVLHGADTSVMVTREGGKITSSYSRLEIQKGVISTKLARRTSVTYRISSIKEAKLILDHDRIVQDDRVHIHSDHPSEYTKNGRQFAMTIPKGITELKVTEVFHEPNTIEFIDLAWLRSNFIATAHPALKTMVDLEVPLEISKQIDAKTAEISAMEAKLTALEARQKDIRANLGVADNEDWRNQLAANDRAIAPLRERVIPELRQQKTILEGDFRMSLRNVTANWSDE